MARRAVRKYVSGKHLLKDLTDNPALPGFVRSLDSPVLKQLIDKIGVEDAAPLIAYSAPGQLAAMVDESVWQSPAPGEPVKFDPTEFLRWLEVLLEVGDEFACERLETLDEDLLATAFDHYFRVLDLSLKIFPDDDGIAKVHEAKSSADCAGLYGNFEVTARHEEEWVTLNPMLDALYLEDPGFLAALLGRTCAAAAYTESRGASLAEVDAADRYARGRERRGYVDPVSARAFLATASRKRLEDLVAEAEYDLDTVRYFAIVERAREEKAEAAARSPVEPVEEADFADLRETVAGVLEEPDAAPVALLPGPDAPVEYSPVRAALAALDPATLEDRMAEIVYLSNALMLGSTLHGSEFTEAESVAAVMAAADLGLDYLGTAEPLNEISREPGLVRLFRIGWNLYRGISADAAKRLPSTLAASTLARSPRAWMLEEVLVDMRSERFTRAVDDRQFDTVHETLQLLSLLLSEEHCAALRGLLNDVPRLLDKVPDAQPDDSDPEYRFIESLDDLDHIDGLFAEIETAGG